jgi:hypothetical protein
VTVQGTASAAATSVAIPAHVAGDLVWVFTRGTTAAPTKPAVAGTVPNWNVPQTGFANTIGLNSAWFVATGATTTTGTWTNATHICVLVLRPDSGKVLTVPTSSTNNVANSQSMIYPALTLSTTSGTSWGVRCGTRGVAVAAVGTAPTGWTAQVAQPAVPLMSVHTRAALVANPVADTVATAGTNSGSRLHTLEVTERAAQQPMVTIT